MGGGDILVPQKCLKVLFFITFKQNIFNDKEEVMTSLRKRTATIALSVAAVAMTAGGIATLSTVTADAEVTEIAPIAKYEFKDATNFGKDSMGNYNMSYRNEWQMDGTGPLLDKCTLIDGGGVQFAG